MSVPVVVSTRNAHKLRELNELLAGTRFRLVPLDEVLPGAPEIDEDGDTFEANAAKKARVIAGRTGCLTIADDSGLEVDALGGRPGVHSARYAGVVGPGADAANNARLQRDLEGVPTPRRTARYRCVLAVVRPDGEARFAAGSCEGRIADTARGNGGFGYDPYFLVDGDAAGRTMAELTAAEKHAISHRGRALRGLLPLLDALAHP